MYLLDFINQHPDTWRNELRQPPFSLKIAEEGDYFLFKYDTLSSDMSIELVQEARGAIIKWDCVEEQYKVVSYPFKKFFNYNEPNAAEIDWETARVWQKVDGSCIQVWYDDGWHFSTLGTIDAFKAIAAESISFGDLVVAAIGSLRELTDNLTPDYTYVFEVTSPSNQIVINYGEKPKLWYLGCRNLISEQEEQWIPALPQCVQTPKYFPYINNLSILQRLAKTMGDNEEGYVVVDRNWNRIKVKGEEYLRLHKLRGNGPLTIRRIIEMIMNETVDDYIAAFPAREPQCAEVKNCLAQLAIECDNNFNSTMRLMKSRRDFALAAKKLPGIISGYLFAKLDGKVDCGSDYVRGLTIKKLTEYCKNKLNVKEIEVEEEYS